MLWTASELAADLECFLDGKAISAAPLARLAMFGVGMAPPDATVLAAGGYGTLCSTLLLLGVSKASWSTPWACI